LEDKKVVDPTQRPGNAIGEHKPVKSEKGPNKPSAKGVWFEPS